ncbi:MAG: hypothetical protein Q8P30_00660 [Candidatus Uhrbacteria bacterium]|nr:hypothetical protein [Candidatus Uhrbacteria bacterium]
MNNDNPQLFRRPESVDRDAGIFFDGIKMPGSTDVAQEIEADSVVSVENRESKLEALLDARHHTAVTVVKLEDYLSDSKDPNFEEFKALTDLSKINEKAVEDMKEIVDRYRKFLAESKASYGLMKEMAGFEKDEVTSPQEFGQRFFSYLLKEEPSGRIDFHFDDGYFAIKVYDSDDFIKIEKFRAKEFQSYKLINAIKSGEYFTPLGVFEYLPVIPRRISVKEKNQIMDSEYYKEYSALYFERSNSYPGLEIRIPVAIASLGKRPEDDFERTKVHERQHLINNIFLRDFSSFEVREAKEYTRFNFSVKDVFMDKLKDELIARVREGSNGNSIRVAFKYGYQDELKIKGSYGRNNKAFLKERTEEEGKAALKEFTELLDENKELFSTMEARGVLVAHLIDIPLYKLPKHFKRLVQYYTDRLETFRITRSKLRAVHTGFDQVKGRTYSPEVQSKVERARILYSEFNKLNNKYDNYNFAITSDLTKAEFEKAVQDLNQLSVNIRELIPEKDPYISAERTIPNIKNLGESARENVTQVKNRILKTIESLPSDMLEEVYGDAESGNVARTVASKAFREEIRKALEALGSDLVDAKVTFVNSEKSEMFILFDVHTQDGIQLTLSCNVSVA